MGLYEELKENITDLRVANDAMLDECLILANVKDVIREKIGDRMESFRVEGDCFALRLEKTLDAMLVEIAVAKLKARKRG